MSTNDFLKANINDLLYGDDKPESEEEEKARLNERMNKIIAEHDRKLINEFKQSRHGLKWPKSIGQK